MRNQGSLPGRDSSWQEVAACAIIGTLLGLLLGLMDRHLLRDLLAGARPGLAACGLLSACTHPRPRQRSVAALAWPGISLGYNLLNAHNRLARGQFVAATIWSGRYRYF